jgi:hypothetical protein
VRFSSLKSNCGRKGRSTGEVAVMKGGKVYRQRDRGVSWIGVTSDGLLVLNTDEVRQGPCSQRGYGSMCSSCHMLSFCSVFGGFPLAALCAATP